MKNLLFAVLIGASFPFAITAQEPSDKEQVLALSRRIDAQLLRRQQEHNITPAAPADDSVYYRRLHLDLAGRIPSLLEARDYLDDRSPDKRWTWTERLLRDDAHTRHLAAMYRSHFLGNVANQQAQFFVPGFERWLQQQLAKGEGLNQIVHGIIQQTGNGQPVFNGFNGNQNVSPIAFTQAAEGKAENLAAATSRVFLGVKLECAQCHAHPFAKWTREQFWEFAAFFGTQRTANGAVVLGRSIAIPNTSKVVQARFLDGVEPKWDDGALPRKVAADWVTAAENPYFARAQADYLWTYLMGQSLLEPIEEPTGDTAVTHPELLDELGAGLVAHRFDPNFIIRAIVHSEAYARTSAGHGSREEYAVFARMPVRAVSPEQLFDSFAEATELRQTVMTAGPNPFIGNQVQGPRGQFLAKFSGQDPRSEPQTSILQALYLMNGKLLNDRTRLENNASLQYLARSPASTARRVETLYLMVLSRLPRPEEAERAARHIDRGSAEGQALADIYWALLNSAEFALNH